MADDKSDLVVPYHGEDTTRITTPRNRSIILGSERNYLFRMFKLAQLLQPEGSKTPLPQHFSGLELDSPIFIKESRNGRVASGVVWCERYHLANNEFPVFSSKKVWVNGAIKELLWIIKGSTSVKDLNALGVYYWDKNASKEFIESLPNFQTMFPEREEGDLGPVYGFQLRHFGAEYKGRTDENNYDGEGVDQIKILIDGLKTDPFSRRHVLSYWNPTQLPIQNLPPCHTLVHFIVLPPSESSNGKYNLSCTMYQRSGDMALGVPFNVVMYSILTIMIAYVCDMEPYMFTHIINDYHLYEEHVQNAIVQSVSRYTEGMNASDKNNGELVVPKCFIRNGASKEIDEIVFEDFIIVDYLPLGNLPFELKA